MQSKDYCIKQKAKRAHSKVTKVGGMAGQRQERGELGERRPLFEAWHPPGQPRKKEVAETPRLDRDGSTSLGST